MTNPAVRFPSTRRTLRKAAVLLSALTFGLANCTTQPSTPQQQEQEDSATASFSIKASDFYDASGASWGRSLSSSSASRTAQAFTFSEVTNLRITVTDKESNTPLYVNFDLALEAGEWTGNMRFLPKNKTLVFQAQALKPTPGSSTPTLLFHGKTEQALTNGDQSIVIVLKPNNDGQDITIPRIRKISVPSTFGSDQSGNVSFTVEANSGEALSYAITSQADGGTFYPTSGTITLLGTSGTFVSQYAPPIVSAVSDFTHTVKVTNSTGHSVTTTFKTKVKPPGNTDGVNNTGVQVLFNPVINTVASHRLYGTGKVIFEASVSDDEAASSLQYAWTFTPTPGSTFEPRPVFTPNAAANSATLENYTPAVHGTITLEVTDSNNGKTTLNYPLPTNQYPDEPVVEGGLTGINSIRAGQNHTCVLFNSGAMRCWGRNDSGQLGYANTLDIGDNEKPHQAGDINLVGLGARIATGGNHTCALLDNGLVRCWGNNFYGQLGYNTTLNVGDGEQIATYGYVNLGGIATKLAAGFEHTCALMSTGKVRCWGRNNYGQLGYGHTENVGDDETPYSEIDVDLGEGKAKNIVAGGAHTCALMENGRVRCWGYNGYGQLGYGNIGTVGHDGPPVDAGEVNVGGDNVIQLAAGKNHTCALLDTGYMRCWGYNGFGQLGYGHTNSIYTPTATNAGDVETSGQVLQVVTGENHTCALLSSGNLQCWGQGSNGRLGNGTASGNVLKPTGTLSMDGTTAFQVTAGASHTCALMSTGAARCWGDNFYGQLGSGNTTDILSPGAADNIQVLAP